MGGQSLICFGNECFIRHEQSIYGSNYSIPRDYNKPVGIVDQRCDEEKDEMTMSVLQVTSTSSQLASPPKKRARRLPYQGYILLRALSGGIIGGLLFTLLLNIFGHPDSFFILLPVSVSLAWAQPMRYHSGKFLTRNLRCWSRSLHRLRQRCGLRSWCENKRNRHAHAHVASRNASNKNYRPRGLSSAPFYREKHPPCQDGSSRHTTDLLARSAAISTISCHVRTGDWVSLLEM